MTIYRQLDAHALALLRNAVERLGSITAVAETLGYGRSSISLALAGKYTGDTRRVRQAIIEKLTGIIACPHLQTDMTAAECRTHRCRPVPTSSRAEVKHWQACQICPFNPTRKTL